ncbi:hypothetical protein CENSYa_0659 [Cenarchaeum symbiosum A]|uniref:Uncharacterized protein n=1 Tax=Cenarchaeum symbiosum (strain A) TaxID=414004 RepID=A0RVC5_CENSY|nr:hypothetical protein CENSYa_0659 [Cenarchaeum symbiosum A]
MDHFNQRLKSKRYFGRVLQPGDLQGFGPRDVNAKTSGRQPIPKVRHGHGAACIGINCPPAGNRSCHI